MTSVGVLQILVFFGLILLCTKPVGLFMSRLFQGERTFLHSLLRPIEVLFYRVCGIREHEHRQQKNPEQQHGSPCLPDRHTNRQAVANKQMIAQIYSLDDSDLYKQILALITVVY